MLLFCILFTPLPSNIYLKKRHPFCLSDHADVIQASEVPADISAGTLTVLRAPAFCRGLFLFCGFGEKSFLCAGQGRCERIKHEENRVKRRFCAKYGEKQLPKRKYLAAQRFFAENKEITRILTCAEFMIYLSQCNMESYAADMTYESFRCSPVSLRPRCNKPFCGVAGKRCRPCRDSARNLPQRGIENWKTT